jgi:hypothetical protein
MIFAPPSLAGEVHETTAVPFVIITTGERGADGADANIAVAE